MSDVERALAFVARREGRRSMSEMQWAHVLSLGLRWLSPAEARQFVSRAVAAGVLVRDNTDLHLVIDPASVEVPAGFRPSATAAAGPADPFAIRLDAYAKALRLPRERLLADVAARQQRMGGLLSAEAALLWHAAESGLDVASAARDALKQIQSGSARPGPAERPPSERAGSPR